MSEDHAHPTDNEDEFADVIASIRALDTDDLEFVDPPDDVWDGIAVALDDLDVPTAPPIRSVTTTPSVGSLSEARERRAAQPAHSRTSGRSMLLAAAAVVVLVAGIVAFQTMRTDDTQILAAADLEFDPTAYDAFGQNAVASVELVEDADGLGVEFDSATLPGSQLEDANLDLELWLIDIDDTGTVVDLVSLGVVDDIDHRFAVPDGYDPAEYDVVDISVEPRDDDPHHSGRTILRGTLRA
jgi:hypothetical protein